MTAVIMMFLPNVDFFEEFYLFLSRGWGWIPLSIIFPISFYFFGDINRHIPIYVEDFRKALQQLRLALQQLSDPLADPHEVASKIESISRSIEYGLILSSDRNMIHFYHTRKIFSEISEVFVYAVSSDGFQLDDHLRCEIEQFCKDIQKFEEQMIDPKMDHSHIFCPSIPRKILAGHRQWERDLVNVEEESAES